MINGLLKKGITDKLDKICRMLGIKVPMNYVRDESMCFYFFVEDDEHASVSFLKEGFAKVWYVCSPQCIREFEQFMFKHLFKLDYLDNYNDGRRQMFPQKASSSIYDFDSCSLIYLFSSRHPKA